MHRIQQQTILAEQQNAVTFLNDMNMNHLLVQEI